MSGSAVTVTVRLTLLGGFDARPAAGDAVNLPTKKAQALLAYLGMRPGQAHQRDKLAALLWGERSDEHARDGLRHALGALRKALPGAEPPSLLAKGQTLALNPAVVEVDVATFERRVAEGTPEALEQAAELYRGDLLLGFTVSEPLFEEWLVAERERLREVALEALARLLAHQTRAGGTERAIQTALRLLGLDPLQEAAHRTLMRLYARQGRRGAALKQYQVCVGVLQRELGAEPEAETKQLYQELMRRPAEAVKARDSRWDSHVRPAGQAAPTRLDLPAAETPLFGREAELGRLQQLLDETIRGHGHVAVIIGEAGIGKTRLLTALAAEALQRGCRTLIGRCHESDSILPFGPWVDACRRGELTVDGEILSALPPPWQAQLTRLFPEANAGGLPPPSDSDLRLFEAVTQLVEQVAARQPLVLMLEDLHWADEMSLRLFAFVSRRIPKWAALVVATAREEELADGSVARRTVRELSREARSVRLVLPPLSRPDTTRLVQALTRSGSDAQKVARLEEQVWTVSEGNPFVTVETTRALQEGTALPEAGTLPLPQQVEELIASQLERLSDRARELASVAAVIGREFEFPLLQRAGGLDEHATAKGVEELVRRRVLQGVGEGFDFSHDRVRAVVAGQLLAPRRKLLHRRVGEAIEAVHAGNLADHIEQLAHHALQGGLREKAVGYLRQAGLRAAARSALHDARLWFEQALGVLETLPESQPTLEQAFEIRLELRPVLGLLGEGWRMLERLHEAEALAEQLNDDHRRGRVCAFMTNVHMVLGDLDEALVTGTRALEIAGRLGDVRLRILTTTYLEQVQLLRGEYKRVVELATHNLAALPADRVYEYLGATEPASVIDRVWLVVSLAELGRFDEAAEYEAEAIRLAGPTQNAYTVGLAHLAASVLHLLKGDWAKARSLVEHEIAVLRTGNVVNLLHTALASSAWALAQLGQASEALNRIREGQQLLELRVARGIGNFGGVYHSLSRACLLLGRLDEARSLGDRAIESLSSHPGFAARALHLLGDIATHSDRFDAETGETHYRQALALAEPREMRPLVAQCHLGLGRLYRRTGKRDQAREHLATATTMYRDMDIRFWLEQADAEMKELA